nr:MAG TPA: hypothetical protein [Caudoviricetes sp.]
MPFSLYRFSHSVFRILRRISMAACAFDFMKKRLPEPAFALLPRMPLFFSLDPFKIILTVFYSTRLFSKEPGSNPDFRHFHILKGNPVPFALLFGNNFSLYFHRPDGLVVAGVKHNGTAFGSNFRYFKPPIFFFHDGTKVFRRFQGLATVHMVKGNKAANSSSEVVNFNQIECFFVVHNLVFQVFRFFILGRFPSL